MSDLSDLDDDDDEDEDDIEVKNNNARGGSMALHPNLVSNIDNDNDVDEDEDEDANLNGDKDGDFDDDDDDMLPPAPPSLLSAMVEAVEAKGGNITRSTTGTSTGTLRSSLPGDLPLVRRQPRTTTTETPEPPHPLSVPGASNDPHSELNEEELVLGYAPVTPGPSKINQRRSSGSRKSFIFDRLFQKRRPSQDQEHLGHFSLGDDDEWGFSDMLTSPFDGRDEWNDSQSSDPKPKGPSKVLQRMKQGMAITRDDGALITDYYQDRTGRGRSTIPTITSQQDDECMRHILFVIGVIICLLVIVAVVVMVILVLQEHADRNAE